MDAQVLNFIWISNEPSSGLLDAECMISHDDLERALQTATRNPDIKIIVWIDSNLYGQEASLTLQRRLQHLVNMEVTDLNEISRYQRDSLFRKSEKSAHDASWNQPIWQKADYVRIVVLEHVLSERNFSTAFYSDLDIIDPPVNVPIVQEYLDSCGMVFGHTPTGNLENQFMGFRATQLDFITGQLLPKTKIAICLDGDDGYNPLRELVFARFPASQIPSVITYEYGRDYSAVYSDNPYPQIGLAHNLYPGLELTLDQSQIFPLLTSAPSRAQINSSAGRLLKAVR